MRRFSLKKGSAQKSEFLATMDHEIRTSMNGIIGLTDRFADLDLSEDAQAYARTINVSADALLAIINDILDISKLDVRHLTIEPRQFDFNSCFRSSVELFSPQAASKGIYLDVFQDEVFPK